MPEDDLDLRFTKRRGVRFVGFQDLDLDGLGSVEGLGDVAGSSARLASEARSTLDRLEELREEIWQDDHLSEEGKQAKLEHAVAQDPDLDFDPLREKLEGRRRRLEERREALLSSPVEEADPTDSRTAILEQEIRRKFNRMDVAGRRQFLSRAVEEGDELALRATLFAPPSLVELSPDRREQFRETLVQEVAGEELEQVEGALEVVERATSEVESAEQVRELVLRDEHAAPMHEGDLRAERNRRHQEEAREREQQAATAS
jgi:hypothetical protein